MDSSAQSNSQATTTALIGSPLNGFINIIGQQASGYNDNNMSVGGVHSHALFDNFHTGSVTVILFTTTAGSAFSLKGYFINVAGIA